ncbi:predicted protein [Phaeodactylum tricornutum CCAP 1055/1]|uniref:BZIP domain-containing protein n=2 Tax=Phaeodactylum tricornutum TaxID=2850 RepID=B7G5G2_PHATC|nr:predicted protein [Phaeodactylum tricornutum CCAP 1055/1]EEC46309.1 predicted protein [Phaeodactylum tricornutum CCAP 1055/1]|eukprot:XP_002182408.1 predicted protein [Phaeodactylum tricornutum CCAP 1055/1]
MTEVLKGENLPGELPEVREPQGAASNDDSDEDSRSDDDEVADDGTGRAGEPIDELTRVRREKRLAMNRESARTRRKRKKILLESLEQQVADLNKRNQSYRIANENLKTKVTQLETDLGMARSTIAVLTQQPRTGAAELAPGRPLPQGEVLGANELNRQDHLRRLLQARSQLNSQRGPIPAATQLDLQSFEQASLQRERAILNALGHLDSNSCDSGHGMIEDAGRRNCFTRYGPCSFAHTLPPQLPIVQAALRRDLRVHGGVFPFNVPGFELDMATQSPQRTINSTTSMIEELLKRRGGQKFFPGEAMKDISREF